MKVYFDTEFTGLRKDTTLISIGCVDENGREFYAELNDYDESQCDEWIQENVIANLDGKNVGSKSEIAAQLEEWLSEYYEVELVSDVCHYDMVLFIDLFGTAFDLPDGVAACCHDINQDIAAFFSISQAEAFDKSREEIADKIAGDKHNSLYDAKVIKSIYEKLNGTPENEYYI